MKLLPKAGARASLRPRRYFSTSTCFRDIRHVAELPKRVQPQYQEVRHHDLLGLQWPSPPRNFLLTIKDNTPAVTEAFIEYAKHIRTSYPDAAILLEPKVAQKIEGSLAFPVYSTGSGTDDDNRTLFDKVDMMSTLGGDGTILRAASLFSACEYVPPILSFSMGTLGFLGEWKFKEYKRAFREVYMSGAKLDHERPSLHQQNQSVTQHVQSVLSNDRQATSDMAENPSSTPGPAGWSSIRGKFMGHNRAARVLLRNRLKVGVYAPDGNRVSSDNSQTSGQRDIFAMNEVILHRGRDPHLAVVEVFVGGRFLTEAVADGMIISTPTGSTAYSLSSGGCIVHPLVSSLLLTPICPRSLSFRPLVLPANTPITLRLSEKNRGRDVDVSIDGVRRPQGLSVGMELRVSGEEVKDKTGHWFGGVPSVVRGTADTEPGSEDSWVGGLNGLLKFNYPFGEE